MQIRCLAEDKDGFIWAGTINGLYRFDAHGFMHYKASEKDTNGLCENFISALYVTKENQLWIGTERKGIVWFDKAHNRFIAIKNKENELNNITPSEFVEDHEGNIWFTNKGSTLALGRIDKTSHGLTYFKFPSHLIKGRGDNGLSLSFDSLQHLYVGSTDGILKFNIKTMEFENNVGVRTDDFQEFTITQQIQSNDKSIWLSLFGFGLVHYTPQTNKLIRYPIPKDVTNGNVQVLTLPDNNLFIFAGKKSIFLFNTTKRQYKELTDINVASQEGFSNNYALVKSKENILFFGGSNGLFTLDLKNQPSNYIPIPGTSAEKEYKVNSIIYNPFDSCYYAGLFLAKNCSLLSWHKRTLKTIQYNSIEHPKLGKYINKILIDTLGNIWCIDYTHLYRMIPKSTNLVSALELKSIPKQHIIDFYIDHDNKFWLTLSKDGLVQLDLKKNTLQGFHHIKNKTNIDDYTIFGEDTNHCIWVSYQTGVSSFNTKNNSFTNYIVDNQRDVIKRAILNTDGSIWLTKYGKGIYHFIPKTGQFHLYDEREGLGSNLFDDDPLIIVNGNLWTLSRSFLSCYNLTSHTFQNYSGEDLIDLKNLNPNNTFLINRENEFISATDKGIIISDLNKFRKSTNQAHAFINSIKVWGKDWIQDRDLNAINNIELNHDENYLSLGFSSLSFRQDESNQYSYYLDGFDKEWHTTSKEKQVTYTSLPSGTYTFNLKASNYAGIWDPLPKQITIHIHPPFWKTWWFILSVFICINLIAYLIVRNKIKRVKVAARLENKHNLELIEFELKALKAQINPHFLFNALNAIQQQIFSQNTKDAHKYLGKFAKLLRSTLDLSDRRSIQLVDEIELLKNYLELEKVRFKNKFTYTVDVDETLLAENPEIPGMIVQPYVENAIIHGLLNLDENKAGILKISFSRKNDTIQCSIIDNGVGRTKALEIKKSKGITHASKGIAITESRIKLISKLYNGRATSEIIDLYNSQNEPIGTKVILQIPLHEKNEEV